jgi:hypothetical protein
MLFSFRRLPGTAFTVIRKARKKQRAILNPESKKLSKTESGITGLDHFFYKAFLSVELI